MNNLNNFKLLLFKLFAILSLSCLKNQLPGVGIFLSHWR